MYATQLDCVVIFKNLSFFQEWLNVPHVAGFMLGTKEMKKNTSPHLVRGEGSWHMNRSLQPRALSDMTEVYGKC